MDLDDETLHRLPDGFGQGGRATRCDLTAADLWEARDA